MKKMVTRLVALVLCLACVAPVALAAEVTDATEENVINLEYQDYISNQDYYTELAKAGATLVIYVGEENEEAELERIATISSSPSDILAENFNARGANIPTYTYDIGKYGRKGIDGTNLLHPGYTFTNYIYVGCTAYEVYLYNKNNATLTAEYVEKGKTSKFAQDKVPAKSGVVKYVTKPEWYGRFQNPCSVEGYVRKMVMN